MVPLIKVHGLRIIIVESKIKKKPLVLPYVSIIINIIRVFVLFESTKMEEYRMNC